MKYDELAFFNQQLAHMLRDGLPLEGAIRQLCGSMRAGRLRSAFGHVEAALAQGSSLDEALGGSGLPPLYARMVQVGVKGGNLPGVLAILGDHYQRAGAIWTRLKGILFYPVLILVLALALALFVAFFIQPRMMDVMGDMAEMMPPPRLALTQTLVLGPPVAMAVMLGIVVLLFALPGPRGWLRWRLPAFKDAGLAQLASSAALMLRGGVSFGEAVAVLGDLEGETPAGAELRRWDERLRGGSTRFVDVAEGGRVVPPLFVWLVGSSGDDLAAGFERAAEAYEARAHYRVELMLFGALPISILVLSAMLMVQMGFLMSFLVQVMNLMQSMGMG